jgi:AraC-like DNA-binding protein
LRGQFSTRFFFPSAPAHSFFLSLKKSVKDLTSEVHRISGEFMGRLSKGASEFKRKVGMTPVQFSRMIKERVAEELEKKKPSE